MSAAVEQAVELIRVEIAETRGRRGVLALQELRLRNALRSLEKAMPPGQPDVETVVELGYEPVTLVGAPELAADMVKASQTATDPATGVSHVMAGERQGDTPGSPAPSPSRKWDYVEVAQVLVEARERGQSSAVALVERYGPLSASVIKNVTYRANRVGAAVAAAVTAPAVAVVHPVAVDAPPPLAPSSTRGMVLACDECDAEFAPHEAPKMNRHALSEHHRRPSAGERTPVVAVAR